MRTIVRMGDNILGQDDTRSQRERMLAGDWYEMDDELASIQSLAQELQYRYGEQYRHDKAAAAQTLAEMLGSLGEDCDVRPPFYVDYGRHLHIGARTFINYGLQAADVAEIRIGEDVQIGPYVQLLTPIHPTEPEARRAKLEAAAPIVIGDNVWLGGGVIVCPGVSIGENTVVGAGSVVVKDLPANVVAVGNPAKPIREL